MTHFGAKRWIALLTSIAVVVMIVAATVCQCDEKESSRNIKLKEANAWLQSEVERLRTNADNRAAFEAMNK